MKDGLEKTRTGFWGNILNTLTGSKIDDDLYDSLEEQLILADVGGEVAIKLVDELRDRVQQKGLKTGEEAADALRDLIAEEMRPEAEMALEGHPAVLLVIGVNGVGKTTSIAKLADYYTRQGRKVMLAAGDTFRAAASEQLEIWADRAGVPLVKAGEGADPAAVIFDTVKSATARGYDMVIADTAGRLHNKANLMAELSKISRSVKKASPEASLETLLVLDAITGQNAISQAKEFCKAANATGIILTKLDGTAALAQSLQGREEGAHGLANAGGGLTKQPLAALAGTVDFPRQRPLPGAVRRKREAQGLQALVPAGGPVQLPPCPRDVIPQQALEKGVQRGGGKVPGVPHDLVGVDLIIGQPNVQRVQRLLLCVNGSVDHALGPVAGAAVLPQLLGGEGGGLDLVDDGGAVLILKNAVGTALNGECDARDFPRLGEEDLGCVSFPRCLLEPTMDASPLIGPIEPGKTAVDGAGLAQKLHQLAHGQFDLRHGFHLRFI